MGEKIRARISAEEVIGKIEARRISPAVVPVSILISWSWPEPTTETQIFFINTPLKTSFFHWSTCADRIGNNGTSQGKKELACANSF